MLETIYLLLIMGNILTLIRLIHKANIVLVSIKVVAFMLYQMLCFQVF